MWGYSWYGYVDGASFDELLGGVSGDVLGCCGFV